MYRAGTARINACGDSRLRGLRSRKPIGFRQWVVHSVSVHDFKFCKCGTVAVDGGREYLKRCGERDNWEELSELLEE